ncbi:hypothetical protein Microterr_29980 [Microbacterium terricola]|uniref:SnoaL-like domain-containing protein n=1 Tax=Microbacterium terricola TaxID=344163 RepID=A0ABM8E2Z2_9MICO|nr:hypothetical protein Microterr_29980 [Microbacterium terricola]
MYRQFYSPTAFVQHYLDLLAHGRAADALTIAGVAVDSTDLDAAGLDPDASDALLRRAALASLDDIEITEERVEGDTAFVTVDYTAGGYPGRTTFEVARDGMIGVVPAWRFATSPLAVLDLTVQGSMAFDVNGFELDKRQVSPEGVDADPRAPLSMLVFSPGAYAVSVDTAVSATPGVAVLSDSPFTDVAVEVQAEPTDEFVAVVQDRVSEFLSSCATQQVLQPTGCPFGYFVEDRIASLPAWEITDQPRVSVRADGADWKIPSTEGVARISVQIQSLFDGTIREVVEEVPFVVTGAISILPDGAASIQVTGVDTR